MALSIRSDLSSADLRAQARRLPSPRAASRALAIANALDGMTRAEAARLAGMERQALRDAVTRYNVEGLAGLEDRPKPGRPPGLTEGEEAALAGLILRGPDPEGSGISSYTREDIALLIEQRFGRHYHPASLSKVLRRMGFSRQKARQVHPSSDPKAQAAWVKGAAERAEGGSGGASGQTDRAVCPGWSSASDARQGGTEGPRLPPLVAAWPAAAGTARQSVRICRHLRRCRTGNRQPATGNDFCLMLPSVSTTAMSVFLRGFSEQLAPDVHAVLVLDGASWHVAAALQMPDNVTPVKLPPYAPELNPVERVWLYLRERFLSHRLHADQEAVMAAACKAWNRLTPDQLRSLCSYPRIRQVTS